MSTEREADDLKAYYEHMQTQVQAGLEPMSREAFLAKRRALHEHVLTEEDDDGGLQ